MLDIHTHTQQENRFVWHILLEWFWNFPFPCCITVSTELCPERHTKHWQKIVVQEKCAQPNITDSFDFCTICQEWERNAMDGGHRKKFPYLQLCTHEIFSPLFSAAVSHQPYRTWWTMGKNRCLMELALLFIIEQYIIFNTDVISFRAPIHAPHHRPFAHSNRLGLIDQSQIMPYHICTTSMSSTPLLDDMCLFRGLPLKNHLTHFSSMKMPFLRKMTKCV